MTLKEGIGAIVSSGMLEQDCVDNDEDDGGYQAGASEEHSGVGRVRGMSRAWELEYFNSRTGTWDAVRNETDWCASIGRTGQQRVWNSVCVSPSSRTSFVYVLADCRKYLDKPQPREETALSANVR